MTPNKKSVYDYFCEYVTENGDMRFLFDENRSYTASQTFGEIKALGNDLYRAGVRQNDILALRATRSLDSALFLLTTQIMGVVVALTDPHNGVGEFVKESGIDLKAKWILSNEKASSDISANGNWLLVDVESGKETPIVVSYPARSQKIAFDVIADVMKPAMIIFTSGSTGKSKGVVLSQYNYMNHIRNYSDSGCYAPDDVSMEVLPIHHVFGVAVIMMGLYCRYMTLFPKSTDVSYISDCIDRYKITRLDGVPSFAYALANRKQTMGYDMSSLRIGVLGGAPSTRAQFNFIEEMLGLKLVPVYGMSECIGITGCRDSESADARASSVGRFLPMCDGHIVGFDGKDVPMGEEGEICVKGPAVMLGYYDDDEGTRQAVDEDGLLHTGDLGYVDGEGFVHITGRKKDIIIRNGINISAAKIENKILTLPFVYSVAVVGIKDEHKTELPCAMIVLKEGQSISLTQLKESIKEVVTKLEMPEKIFVYDSLPMTSSGKVDKESIKEIINKRS